MLAPKAPSMPAAPAPVEVQNNYKHILNLIQD